MQTLKKSLLMFMLLCLSACNEKSSDESQIRQKTKAYEEAFNRGDAKALSLFWTEDAEYIIPESGEVAKGRNAIEKVFQNAFQRQKNPKIAIKTLSVEFPKNDQAVETGTATVTDKEGKSDKTTYKAYYEKQGGEWLLKKVEEAESAQMVNNYEHLKGLEWLLGKWADESNDVQITSNWNFDKNKNFLIQQFEVKVGSSSEIEGRQVLTWDPIKKTLHSWIFDSDGTFGEGLWKKKGDAWVVESSQTLADGRRASATNIYTPINQNSFTWKSVDREVGGELLPDIKPITIVRRKG